MNSEISNLSDWFAAALKFGQQRNDPENWPQIRVGTDQHKSWLRYFRDNDLLVPAALSQIHMNKAQTWTAPCEWPRDLNFVVKRNPKFRVVTSDDRLDY